MSPGTDNSRALPIWRGGTPDRQEFGSVGGSARESAPAPRNNGVWRNNRFRDLWIIETLSQTGIQVSAIAFPLIAVTILHSEASVAALLVTAQYLPVLFVSLLAGRWVDRRSMRAVVLACYVPRTLIVSAVPIAYLFGVLNIWFLMGCAFAIGCFSAVFDVAFVSYVPRLVGRHQVEDANSKVDWTYSISEIAGRGLGGVLVQSFGAALAPFGNTAAWLVGCVFGWRGEFSGETPNSGSSNGTGFRELIRDALMGLQVIWRIPVLRVLMVQSSLFHFLGFVAFTLFAVFGTEVLHLSPATLGWILASGSVGAFISARYAPALGRRFGMGRTAVWGIAIESFALGLVPLAGGPTAVAVGLSAAGFILHGLGAGVSNVQLLNIRTLCVPSDCLGRVVGGWRLVTWGAIPFNGLLAAGLSMFVGVRWAIAILVGLLAIASLAMFRTCLMTYTGSESTMAAPPALSTAPNEGTG